MRIIENKMIKKISKEKKRLIIGATGASGIPVLQKCLELIKEEEDYESWLVLTKSGELTCQQESKLSVEEIKNYQQESLKIKLSVLGKLYSQNGMPHGIVPTESLP